MTEVRAEEFEKLLKGESIPHPDGEGNMNLLSEDRYGNRFINCNNIKVWDFIKLRDRHEFPIHITGKSLLGDFEICDSAKTRDFEISDSAEIGDFKITDTAQTGDFRIYGEAQTGDFWISDKALTGGFRIYGQAQTKRFRISDSAKSGNFTICNKAQMGNFEIYGSAQTGSFNILQSAQTGSFNIFGKAQTGYFKIFGKAHTGDFKIFGKARIKSFSVSQSAELGELLLMSIKSTSTFELRGNVLVKSLVISSNLTSITLAGGRVENQIRVSKVETDRLMIIGTNNQVRGKIYIDDCKIRSLVFTDFVSEELIQISGVIKPSGTQTSFLEFHDSSFKSLELVGNDFEPYDFLVFKNSNIRSAFIADTTFPEHVQSPDPKIDDDTEPGKKDEDITQKKLFSEQVKTIYKNQGNSTEALIYLAKELNQHYENLRWETEFWDKLNLFYHKYTTEFGTKWQRGAAVFLGVTIFLYGILLLGTDKEYLRPLWSWPLVHAEAWHSFGVYTSHFFEFINPTTNLLSKWQFIYYLEGVDYKAENASLPAFTSFWLYISKFIMVTLLYQFIQAFRKFGKV